MRTLYMDRSTRAPHLAVLALAASYCVACSTVRLTPSASKYLKNGKTTADAQADLDKAQRALTLERTRVDRVIMTFERFPELRTKIAAVLGTKPEKDSASQPTIEEFVQSVHLKDSPQQVAGQPAAQSVAASQEAAAQETLARRQELAQVIVEHWWMGAFASAENAKEVDEAFAVALDGTQRPAADAKDPASAPLVASDSRSEFLRDQVRLRQNDVNQLQVVESGRWEYFVDGSVYFSIEPLIAIRPDLEAVAVPSLAVNWRPFDVSDFKLKEFSALGLQLAFGGALNPSGGTEENTSGALGIGMSVPVADVGAFSFGAVWFSDDDDSHSAPYVSLTLGDFGKSTQGARD